MGSTVKPLNIGQYEFENSAVVIVLCKERLPSSWRFISHYNYRENNWDLEKCPLYYSMSYLRGPTVGDFTNNYCSLELNKCMLPGMHN